MARRAAPCATVNLLYHGSQSPVSSVRSPESGSLRLRRALLPRFGDGAAAGFCAAGAGSFSGGAGSGAAAADRARCASAGAAYRSRISWRISAYSASVIRSMRSSASGGT